MKTLTGKIVFRQAIAVAVTLLVIMAVTIGFVWNTEEKRLAEKADRVAARLQLALAAPIERDNRTGVELLAKAELTDPEVVGVLVNSGYVPWVAQGIDETQVDQRILTGEAELPGGKSVRVFVSNHVAFAEVNRQLSATCIELIVILAVLQIVNLILFRRIVSRPIRSVIDRIRHIAQGDGDLTMTIDHRSKDEIGELASAFNAFVVQLRGVVDDSQSLATQIENVSGRLAAEGVTQTETAESLLRASHAIDAHMDHLQGCSQNALASGRDIDGRMTEFERHVQRQNGATEASSAAVEEMLASITSLACKVAERRELARILAENASEGHDRAQAVQEHMDHVVSLSDRVAEMTDVIRSIAEQTNLLSLNAAIEAAHAGDAGHGFAVVAEEIRKLADTAAEQSGSISEAVGQIVQEIQCAGVAAGQNSALFDQMFTEVGAVVSAFEEVSQSLHEMSLGSNEIQTAMFDLKNATVSLGENRKSIVNSAATILASLNEEADLVNQTKDKSSGIIAEADGLDTQTRVTAVLIEEARNAVERLQRTFQRFSTHADIEEYGVELKPAIFLE